MLRPILLTILILFALPLSAQDGQSRVLVGNDAYLTGQSVTLSEEGIDDLFAAGERVRSDAPLSGNAHMIGRRVLVNEPVAGALYGAGQSVDVTAPVAGDVAAFGMDIQIDAPVGGDLRAMGQSVEVAADVGEDLIVGAESLFLDAAVAGNASIGAGEVRFGEGARVAGMLHVYTEDPDSVEVPASVAPAERIVLHDSSEWSEARPGIGDVVGQSFGNTLSRKLSAIVMVTLAALAVAWLAPDMLTRMRERALEQPGRALWFGFLGISAAIGSLVLLVMTGIGILAVPISILTALVLAFAGYVIGVYVLGVAIMGWFGQGLPDSLGDRAIAAVAGAVVMALVSLLPFVGWLASLALAFLGAGALLIRWIAPGFYTEV